MYKRQEKRIDYKEIDSLLGSLIYPIHFLDFETDNPAIPRFAGMHPFERIPFQFSVHVLEKDGMLIHQEFLHTDNTDPREAIAKSLVTDIRPIGSIVAYNASFEQGVIKELATTVPELSEPLLSFLPRFFDLLIVFRNHYKDPAFLGSNSIKSVLPVLVPELSYKDLQVRNGGDAQVTWNEMILEPDPVRKQELAQALREYCQLDTFAMVRLFQKLFKTVTSSMAGIIDISE